MSHITTEIKSALKELGIKPNKALGQNFLINTAIYDKLIAAVDPQKGETIIEVGPGLGTVTRRLVDSGANVLAIEKDRNLIPYLENKFDGKNIKIIEHDILTWQPSIEGEYKIVGNLPYYLTAHLLRTIFFNWPEPQTITIMVQKEVADKLVAKPPEMSYLGMTTKLFATTKRITNVKPDNFYPAPDVDSAIIQLTPTESWDELRENDVLFKLISAGFSQKRKQLLNTLSTGLNASKDTIEQLCKEAKIDPKHRAQTLSADEWKTLATCAQQTNLET